jgi:nicotinamide mononucleotide transporter
MTLIEIIAALFGLTCVWFCVIRNVWNWPTGLVQVSLLIIVFYNAKLYADMVLQILYVVLQCVGWIAWLRSNEGSMEPVQVRLLSWPGKWLGILATILMTFVFHWLLSNYTDAELPLADSFVAAASLVAQTLLVRRFVESWIYWIVVDTVGIWLFGYKQLYPTAVLYGVFWVMAVIGWISWQKACRAATATKERKSVEAIEREAHTS